MGTWAASLILIRGTGEGSAQAGQRALCPSSCQGFSPPCLSLGLDFLLESPWFQKGLRYPKPLPFLKCMWQRQPGGWFCGLGLPIQGSCPPLLMCTILLTRTLRPFLTHWGKKARPFWLPTPGCLHRHSQPGAWVFGPLVSSGDEQQHGQA